jgi:hypothetical protein
MPKIVKLEFQKSVGQFCRDFYGLQGESLKKISGFFWLSGKFIKHNWVKKPEIHMVAVNQ